MRSVEHFILFLDRHPEVHTLFCLLSSNKHSFLKWVTIAAKLFLSQSIRACTLERLNPIFSLLSVLLYSNLLQVASNLNFNYHWSNFKYQEPSEEILVVIYTKIFDWKCTRYEAEYMCSNCHCINSMSIWWRFFSIFKILFILWLSIILWIFFIEWIYLMFRIF